MDTGYVSFIFPYVIFPGFYTMNNFKINSERKKNIFQINLTANDMEY